MYRQEVCSEKDWKLFRKRIGDWQERYMNSLNNEYIRLLQQDKLASEKFWELEKRVKSDKQKSGVVADMRRSNMMFVLLELIRDDVITLADVSEFSDDVKETIQFLTKRGSI